MGWIWPSGLTGRVATLLIIALVTVQLLTLVFFLQEQSSHTAAPGLSTSQAEVIVDIVRALPPARRESALALMSRPGLALSLSSEPDTTMAIDPRAWAEQDARLRGTGTQEDSFQVQLTDDQWLRFKLSTPQSPEGWLKHIWAQLLFTAIAIVALAALAARQLTRPLRTFAAAAERLGTDVDAPPIEESGSVELQRAAGAFNLMQERLQRYIHNRTQMLAAISHDLRTHLTRLRLRTEYIGDARQRAKATADLHSMETMLQATLTFARNDAELEPTRTIDLAQLLHTRCDDFSDLGHDVIYEGPDRLAFLCRPIALQRAVDNVMSNAVHHGQSVRVSLLPGDTAIGIAVRDDGPGIPAEDLERAFEPFVRLDVSRSAEEGSGSGLGLAIARASIDSHGGEIVLGNRPEGGLIVTIQLPAACA